jgi:hypothetical protein
MLRQGNRAYAADFARKGLPADHLFGSYDEYFGFSAEDIALIARHVKSKGKGLMICGFTDFAAEAIGVADVFVSCAPVRTGVFGSFAEEIRSLEVPGEQSSASCEQTVKSEADILLMRPKDKKGGLAPLAVAVSSCRIAYRNLFGYIRYFIFASLMRIVAIGFPMLFGQMSGAAIHLLLLGFLADMAALLIFMRDTRRVGAEKKNIKKELLDTSITSLPQKHLPLTAASLLGAVLTLLIPNLIGLLDIFGNYIYKAEYTFTALLLLQLSLFICVYVKDILSKAQMRKLFTNKVFIIELAVAFVLVLICFLTPLGNLFGLVNNPIVYLIASFLPSIAFLICFYAMSFPKKKKTGEEKSKKMRKKQK